MAEVTHLDIDDNWPSEAIHVNGDKEASHPWDPNLGVTSENTALWVKKTVTKDPSDIGYKGTWA